MQDFIKKRAERNYNEIMSIISKCKTKIELINNVRQEEVVIDEFQDTVNIYKDELKIVIKTDKKISVKRVLVFDENYEDYVNLF